MPPNPARGEANGSHQLGDPACICRIGQAADHDGVAHHRASGIDNEANGGPLTGDRRRDWKGRREELDRFGLLNGCNERGGINARQRASLRRESAVRGAARNQHGDKRKQDFH